jgi:hypothetical protein
MASLDDHDERTEQVHHSQNERGAGCPYRQAISHTDGLRDDSGILGNIITREKPEKEGELTLWMRKRRERTVGDWSVS